MHWEFKASIFSSDSSIIYALKSASRDSLSSLSLDTSLSIYAYFSLISICFFVSTNFFFNSSSTPFNSLTISLILPYKLFPPIPFAFSYYASLNCIMLNSYSLFWADSMLEEDFSSFSSCIFLIFSPNWSFSDLYFSKSFFYSCNFFSSLFTDWRAISFSFYFSYSFSFSAFNFSTSSFTNCNFLDSETPTSPTVPDNLRLSFSCLFSSVLTLN